MRASAKLLFNSPVQMAEAVSRRREEKKEKSLGS
jgi:hypothetical protein